MARLASLSITLIALSACGVFWQYRSLHEIPDMQWKKEDVQRFEFELGEARSSDVYVMIRYVYGFQYDALTCQMNMLQDDQIVHTEEITIPIKNEEGEYLGEGSVDLWDIEHLALKNHSFEPGDYTVEIEHTMPMEKVPLIMEVGLLMKKPKP